MAKKKQMLVMHRDLYVTSNIGYSYLFKKGVPQMVVGEMVEECMKYGAVPPEGKEVEEHEESPKRATPRGQDRHEKIKNAMEEMVERNERGDFGASGAPNLRALETTLGFKVDKKERDSVWNEVNRALHGA